MGLPKSVQKSIRGDPFNFRVVVKVVNKKRKLICDQGLQKLVGVGQLKAVGISLHHQGAGRTQYKNLAGKAG